MPSDTTTPSVDDTTPAAPDATCLAVEALRHTMREMWPGDQLPTSHQSISSQLGDRGHLYARELALIEAGTLKLDLDHVWTVDGEPLGIRHEFQLDGDHVIARDVAIKNGRQHGAAHERRIPLIQAVHVLLNATAAELEAIENRLVEATPTPESRLADPVEIRRWTGSGPPAWVRRRIDAAKIALCWHGHGTLRALPAEIRLRFWEAVAALTQGKAVPS